MLIASTFCRTDQLTSMENKGMSGWDWWCCGLPSSLPPLLRLSLGSSFLQEASGAVLDLDGDEGTTLKQSKVAKKWCVSCFP